MEDSTAEQDMDTDNTTQEESSGSKGNSAFIVPFSDNCAATSLQAAFKTYLEKRQKELASKIKAKKSKNSRIPHSDQKRMEKLRSLFLKQAMNYKGVPYAKRYWTPDDPEYSSPLFLDCCGLIRRVLWDLKKQFGFKLGPWNQAYMYDTLPINLEEKNMKPGDLVFIEGVHYSAKSKVQKHNIVHVEIYLGEGERSLGARWQKGYVQEFDSFRFVSKSYEIKRYIFRSIDTWLVGICRSFCPEHRWSQRNIYSPKKYSIFNIENAETKQGKRKSKRKKKKRKSNQSQQSNPLSLPNESLNFESSTNVEQNDLLESCQQDMEEDNLDDSDVEQDEEVNLDEFNAGDTDDELVTNDEKDTSSICKIVEEFLRLDDNNDEETTIDCFSN